MYDIAKKAREGMRSKAQRLAGQKYERVDSSDWTPPAPINADVKTGMRPISKQALKSGGTVGKKRADRVARKSGGRIGIEMANKNMKAANEERSGIKHDGGLKKGGRAKKADGGDAIGDLIRRTPTQAKKPDFQMPDKVPLPPRRQPDRVPPRDYKKADPRLIAAAKGGKVKHSDEAADKKLIKSMVKGKALKDKACSGGRMKRADGGDVPEWKQRITNMVESSRKRDEETTRRVDESKKKYPNMTSIERAEQSIKDKFSPKYFANLKKQKQKDLDEDKGYQEFSERRSKKADGGAMDPRLGLVKNKALEFGQNVVTPGLKKGGRIKKQIGGALATNALPPAGVPTNAIPPAGMPTNALPRANTGVASSGMMPPAMGAPSRMPTLPAQAMANAQGVPFQSGGKFAPQPAPVGGAPVGMIGINNGGMMSPMGLPSTQQIGPATLSPSNQLVSGGAPTGMMGLAGGSPVANSAGRSLPPQAMANAQGRPFQGGQFAPPGLANRPPMPRQVSGGAPSGFASQPAPISGGMVSQPAPVGGGMASMPAPLGAPTLYSPIGRKSGGRVARAEGGKTSKAKGKTNINITINTKSPAGDMGVNRPPMPPMAGGPPMPQMPAGPASAPMPPGPPQMGAPGGFKRGGKVYRSYKDMDAGAGSGLGRLEKTEIASRSAKKAGGKVYRSYKDMDAGSGSGLGRLEKTEIQKRKK